MKKTLFTVLFLLGISFAWMACDNDDDNYTPSKEIVTAFNAKFPDAQKVEWQQKYSYQVADFTDNGVETEAWFDASGSLILTEMDIPYAQIPTAAKEWIAASEYASWKVDDVDKVIRKDRGTLYVVELEQDKNEVAISFSEAGDVIKIDLEADNSDDKYLPVEVPAAIKTYLTENFPQAVIMEVDKDKEGYDVDIMDGTVHKEIMFNAQMQWLSTNYDVDAATLPQAVKDAISQTEWADWTIYEVEFWQVKDQKDFYEIELAKGTEDHDLKIDIDGTILP